LLMETWFIEDIEFMKKFTFKTIDLTIHVEQLFYRKIEERFLFILDPAQWGPNQNFHSSIQDLCKLIISLVKLQEINLQLLIIKIEKAIEYYKLTKRYVYEIKAIYNILLCDEITSDLLVKKGKFSNNLRFMMKKYSNIRRSTGPLLDKKFDLKISQTHFK
jgi:hypothetical protein